MKKYILEYLVCPDCKIDFQISNCKYHNDEIKEGKLICLNCSKSYEIYNYVPRFVDKINYADSFGYEWNKFYNVQLDIYRNNNISEQIFFRKTGWKPDNVRGKIILDAGIGSGRFSDIVSRWGGEIIGVDLSLAVDSAYNNIGNRNNVHIIQADLFNLPFKEETFDIIFSMGVLHHTPDTRKAFRSLVPYLKIGGEMSVYIYIWGYYHYFSDIWRKITTRLPHGVMYYISLVSIPLYYVHKIPALGKIVQLLFPTANWPDWRWRWLDTFDWYTPKYQWKHSWPEVFRWYKEEGFNAIELFEEDEGNPMGGICMRGVKGENNNL